MSRSSDSHGSYQSDTELLISRLTAAFEALRKETEAFRSKLAEACGKLMVATARADALAQEVERLKERTLEFDAGRITYRDGDLSVSAYVKEVLVYHAGSGKPATHIKPEDLGTFLDAALGDRP